jgi:hypothetical protein
MFLLYYFIFLVFYLLEISIVSFFHFLLDHEFYIIEDWIYRHNWFLIIFIKVLSGLVFINLFNIDNFGFDKKKYLNKFNLIPNKVVFVTFVFINSCLISLGSMELNKSGDFNILMIIFSYFGAVLYLGLDVFILSELIKKSKLSSKLLKLLIFIGISLLFTEISNLVIVSKSKYFKFLVVDFIFLMLINEYFKSKRISFSFLVYIIAPSFCLFGLDPIWGDTFSIFHFKKVIGLQYYILLWVISFFYLKYNQNNKLKEGY